MLLVLFGKFVRAIFVQFGGISFSYLLFMCVFLIQKRHYFIYYF